jgi:hypothetical protein
LYAGMRMLTLGMTQAFQRLPVRGLFYSCKIAFGMVDGCSDQAPDWPDVCLMQ